MKGISLNANNFHFTPKYHVKAGLLAYLSFVTFPYAYDG